MLPERHHERTLARDPETDPLQGLLEQGLASDDNGELLGAIFAVQMTRERSKAYTLSSRKDNSPRAPSASRAHHQHPPEWLESVCVIRQALS
jgi:hypothetical protein